MARNPQSAYECKRNCDVDAQKTGRLSWMLQERQIRMDLHMTSSTEKQCSPAGKFLWWAEMGNGLVCLTCIPGWTWTNSAELAQTETSSLRVDVEGRESSFKSLWVLLSRVKSSSVVNQQACTFLCCVSSLFHQISSHWHERACPVWPPLEGGWPYGRELLGLPDVASGLFDAQQSLFLAPPLPDL